MDQSRKQYTTALQLENIPDELKARRQWVLYRLETKDGKPTKIPYRCNGHKASATDPRAWATFAEVCVALQKQPDNFNGIGYVFSPDDPFTGCDLDHCRNAETGEIAAWAWKIIRQLATYAEISQSGTGIHLIGIASLDKLRTPGQPLYQSILDKKTGERRHGTGKKIGGVEMYDRGRFFVVTGAHLDETPATLQEGQEVALAVFAEYLASDKPLQAGEVYQRPSKPSIFDSDDELIVKIGNSKQGAKFDRLMRGDASNYLNPDDGRPDLSRADSGLCAILAWWTNGDASQIERIWSQSALADREKFERADYRDMTISHALACVGGGYDPHYTQADIKSSSVAPQSEAPDVSKERKESQADILMRIAAKATFLRTPENELYARVATQGRERLKALDKRGGFGMWLRNRYMEETGGGLVNDTALQQVIDTCRAIAHERGEEQKIFVRVGKYGEHIYLDLANEHSEAVEITSNGWCVVSETPIQFRRPAGMLALPTPAHGSSLDLLRPFVNAGSDDDFRLMLAWLLGCLHPTGPYVHLGLGGEQGTAKSTTTRYLCRTIDPAQTIGRKMPKDSDTSTLAAHNGWIYSLENLSSMPTWLADNLCCLSTGIADTHRTLFTNSEETIFADKRPAIFNGIEDLTTRGDLRERTIALALPVMTGKRLPEHDLDAQFERVWPYILGALLDAAVMALQHRQLQFVDELPRMADFALWVCGAEKALGWKPGEFLKAYQDNQQTAMQVEIESSPVASVVITFMQSFEKWSGTATEWLEALKPYAPEEKTRGWPTTPRTFSTALRRIAPALRRQGYDIQQSVEGRDNKRIITLRSQNIELRSQTKNFAIANEPSPHAEPIETIDAIAKSALTSTSPINKKSSKKEDKEEDAAQDVRGEDSGKTDRSDRNDRKTEVCGNCGKQIVFVVTNLGKLKCPSCSQLRDVGMKRKGA